MKQNDTNLNNYKLEWKKQNKMKQIEVKVRDKNEIKQNNIKRVKTHL